MYQKLGHRVAEEAQLLAEERWILKALEKVRTQRNCLQIERLQLESMKKQLKVPSGTSSAEDTKSDKAQTTNIDATQTVPTGATDSGTAKEHLLETEALCNKEELNLTVTNSVFSQIPLEDLQAEEDEDEYDEEENCEDLLIDMNMFMHGSQASNFKKT